MFRHWQAGMLVAAACGWWLVDADCLAQSADVLPAGVQAVWDLRQAHVDTTSTRERVCINGLWQWQPAEATSRHVPEAGWGYFKVPGSWPGVTDYMQKDFQTVHPHPSWPTQKLAGVSAAWYQRQITIPAGWSGRRITLALEYLNSYAAVYLDGQLAGEARFPAGEVALDAHCRPGEQHVLSLLVVAMPLQGVRLSFNDSNAAREVQGSVARRGLCGDVYLVATPAAARLTDLAVTTSVRNGQVTVAAAVADLAPADSYTLRAHVGDQGQAVREFASSPFRAADVRDGRIEFSAAWLPDRLWDTHTPQHQYELRVSLVDGGGKLLDTAHPVRFGFREFWIDGRDFYLNGSRIFLSAVPLDNAQVGAAAATYAGARESLERLQSLGINFVYTHNYSCQPGAHLSFAEILRAADDVGMLVALSQPHFSDYDWQMQDADQHNGYADHAAWYVRVAQRHPSVVMYATSHNATGYSEDMNPDLIDGRYDQRSSWAMNNVRRAVRAEAIIRRLDPSRIVYHHSSGNLSALHTSNFYPNFVPIQELSDWFEHWATEGVKPFFACEYGAPFTWDWALYRGWYKDRREFGSAVVPWDFSLAEWNAQFLGAAAYRISDQERRNIRWEADQFRSGRLWHRWDYPHQLGSSDFDERYPILAKYYTDNWRAFRTWGVSAISPWEHHVLFKLRPGLDRNRRVELPTAWEKLQRPGFSPDYLEQRYERMDLAYERSDWTATPAAAAMYRNNRPLLAYLAGPAARFTSQEHNFLPGETVDKQLIAINNARVPVTCQYTWSLALPQPIQGAGQAVIETGQQSRVPLRAVLPDSLPPGTYELTMQAHFQSVADADLAIDETQRDAFSIHVLPPIRDPREAGNAAGPGASGVRIALFDPVGQTGQRLDALGVTYETVAAAADLTDYELLIIGRAALTADGPAPDLGRVPGGLKVLVFEQTAQTLEQRLGFRVQEYGLRNVWPCVAAHPVLEGLDVPHWRDWRGEATLLPSRLTYETSDRYGGSPTVRWCGLEVPRLWRCGNRGNVASVLIEKPARGDFLPILDGGFSLQYSPLLEYREGRGLVLFCQLDVTGRTEDDPAADRVVRNLLRYLGSWQPAPAREALYVGEPAGRAWLEAAGLALGGYDGGELRPDQVLIAAPGSGAVLAPQAAQLARWLEIGGHLLALELDAAEANQFLPSPLHTERRPHVATWFDAPDARSLLAGVGPADVHNRAPRELPLVTGGARPVGNGVLACGEQAGVVFCQQAPYRISRAQGRSPALAVDQREAWDGQHSALLTMGTAPWAQFGQKVPGGEAGKNYTLAVFAKSLDEPVPLRLEVERAASPWDRVVRGPETPVGAEQWAELHVTFAVDQPYPEGWQVYLHCGQEGGRLRVDRFRLYEGPYVPGRPGAAGSPPAAADRLANGSFEDGAEPWFFTWPTEQQNVRRTYRRATFAVLRLLANLGVRGDTPLLSRFAIPASGRGGESVVRNGDFQRMAEGSRLPADWQFTSDVQQATCALEPAAPDADSSCLQIGWPEAAARERGSVMLAQQDVPVQAGQWYRIALRARAAGIGPNGVNLALQNTTNWRSLFEYQRFVPGDDWQEFRFLVQANATATSRTRFQIWYGQPGTLWLADVRMEPCDPPTQGRWLDGLYADQPQTWDDPYRFFRW